MVSIISLYQYDRKVSASAELQLCEERIEFTLFEMEHLLTILTIPQWRKVRKNGVIFIFLDQ